MNKKMILEKNSTSSEGARSEYSEGCVLEISGITVLNNMYAPAAPQGDIKSLAEELLDTLIVAVKASAGIVRILPNHGQALQKICSIGLPAELLKAESTADLNCEICGKAAIGRGIYSVDISACKKPHDCHYANCQTQSIIVASLESSASPENSIGNITLFFNAPPESFEDTSKTLQAFTHLFGVLIEKNKSNREAKRVDLIAERRSIANEIHDSLAQTLVYARMRVNLLMESLRTGNELMASKYTHEIDEALESGQKAVRELITDFRCEMDPSGLLHALQTLTREFSERNDIVLEYINYVADLDLPLDYEIQIYYIVREALANVSMHSGATRARLVIGISGSNYVFSIKDNGMGKCIFTPAEGHYGMKIMRERAARINGEIKIESAPNSGTLVQLSFQNTGAHKERN